MRDSMRAPELAQYVDDGFDNSRGNRSIDQDDNSKKSNGSPAPYNGANVEKVESQRHGSAVFRAAMNEYSSYKTLNRWQASLIYITNQVGLGILSLPSAMQTLGLVPGVIAIIGMGM